MHFTHTLFEKFIVTKTNLIATISVAISFCVTIRVFVTIRVATVVANIFTFKFR